MAQEIFDFNTTAYLAGAKAVVTINNSELTTIDKKVNPVRVKPNNYKKEVEFVPNGDDDSLPLEIMEKVYKNVTVSAGIEFNSKIAYGDGIMVVKKVRDAVTKKIVIEEQLPSEQPEIFKFLDDNNITRQMQEFGVDISTFLDAFAEIILSNETKPKVVQIRHKEYCYSRLSVANQETGHIDFHGYSAFWSNQKDKLEKSVVLTPLLDDSAPIFDIKQRIGLEPNEKGKLVNNEQKRFIMRLSSPVPGRLYYNKPYWWSIFESGWYDFACAIPAFKKALLKNQMSLKYHVKINIDFWQKLFTSEGITLPEKQKERKTLFLQQMNDFLGGETNAGKSFVSYFKYDQVKGVSLDDIVISAIENNFKGGEYLEDSEEASNVIYSALGVHPSIIGASPGKNKSINGTEARELFIIKQAITKPIRDLLLMPLYLAKTINGWDADIHFVIPNIMLTTLDKNTGAEKQIGNQKI